MTGKPTYVTQPYLPPLGELIPYLEEIWQSKVLTNGGAFHQRFEKELSEYLDVEHVSLFANGTIALLTALQALRITGEVITTPYSFVATSHSLLWNNIRPVFVDISPETLNIVPNKIEAAITPQTTAILAVHCYGNPCDVDSIARIADAYNLKVIYDAAHAFGVRCHCGSLLRHGDLSVLSMHATKVFNTFEGGAIVCPDSKIKSEIDNLKNFGFVSETSVVAPGINGKMSEFNSALGVLQLKYIDEAIAKRAMIDQAYRRQLSGVKGLRCLSGAGAARRNFSYFPMLIDHEYPLSRDQLYEKLKMAGIYSRRYFYPLISSFPMYRSLTSAAPRNLPVATEVAQRILCLPIFPDLDFEEVERISEFLATPSFNLRGEN